VFHTHFSTKAPQLKNRKIIGIDLDPFYAFLIFAVLLALENMAAQMWLAPYFRFGIPVHVQRVNPAEPVHLPQATKALSEKFRANPEHPSIRFKLFGERQVAFREVLFENRGGVRYLPVMHSLVRLHPDRGTLALTGYLNWYVLAALVYVVYRSLSDRSFIPVAVLVVFIFGLSYAVQSAVNVRVAEALSRGSNSER
jgi:hypothetical protein